MRCLFVLLFVSAVSWADSTLALTTERLAEALATSNHTEAVALLREIPRLYPAAPESAQRTALRTLGKAAKSKHLPTRHGAFAALGEMRVKGTSKFLRRWLAPPKQPKPAASSPARMCAAFVM